MAWKQAHEASCSIEYIPTDHTIPPEHTKQHSNFSMARRQEDEQLMIHSILIQIKSHLDSTHKPFHIATHAHTWNLKIHTAS